MRIEFNPSKAPAAAESYIVNTFSEYIPDFELGWAQSTFSRVDMSIDVRDLYINDVFVFTNTAACQTSLGENFYIGAPKSNRRILVYDKVRESEIRALRARRRGRPTPETLEGILTRIEFRFTTIGALHRINLKSNPIAGSWVIAGDIESFNASEDWQRFCRQCRGSDGLQGAIKAIPNKAKRANYRSILSDNFTPDWFNEHDVWNEGKLELRRHFPLRARYSQRQRTRL